MFCKATVMQLIEFYRGLCTFIQREYDAALMRFRLETATSEIKISISL